MFNTDSKMRLLVGIWLAAVLIVLSCSVALGASSSTSALLLVVCAVPMAVMLLIRVGSSPPTVAEVLYSVNSPRERR
jgi:hypothetical protein